MVAYNNSVYVIGGGGYNHYAYIPWEWHADVQELSKKSSIDTLRYGVYPTNTEVEESGMSPVTGVQSLIYHTALSMENNIYIFGQSNFTTIMITSCYIIFKQVDLRPVI